MLKNRITAIFLLICLVLPTAGVYTFLKVQKRHIRKEVKKQIISGISKSELVLLSFSKKSLNKELRWKHAKEFAYKEMMYDVVETRSTKDSVFYWCWPDHKETRLSKSLKELSRIALNKNQQRNDQKQRLSKFLNSLFFEETSSRYSVNFTVKILYTGFAIHKFPCYFPSPFPPPPKKG